MLTLLRYGESMSYIASNLKFRKIVANLEEQNIKFN